jgi:hypothetical protein
VESDSVAKGGAGTHGSPHAGRRLRAAGAGATAVGRLTGALDVSVLF